MEANKKEGWSDDIVHGGRTHYYKNGKSLCLKSTTKTYMEYFDKDRHASKFYKDCCICIKKLQKIKISNVTPNYK